MSETTNSSVAQSATICLSDNCIEILDASHALTSYVNEELLLSSARFRVLRRILTWTGAGHWQSDDHTSKGGWDHANCALGACGAGSVSLIYVLLCIYIYIYKYMCVCIVYVFRSIIDDLAPFNFFPWFWLQYVDFFVPMPGSLMFFSWQATFLVFYTFLARHPKPTQHRWFGHLAQLCSMPLDCTSS